MKLFDKKIIFIILFFLVIICFLFYYLTRIEDYESTSVNDFYINDVTLQETSLKTFIVVHIDGEVINPGIVSIPENSRISDAINAAGGPTPLIDVSKINLAYILKDGQKIYVPSIYDDTVEYIQNTAGDNVIVPDSSTDSNIININTATKAELETIPGIGPATASKIIEYRENNNNFKNIEEIMNINGIGDSKFENIKNYITI